MVPGEATPERSTWLLVPAMPTEPLASRPLDTGSDRVVKPPSVTPETENGVVVRVLKLPLDTASPATARAPVGSVAEVRLPPGPIVTAPLPAMFFSTAARRSRVPAADTLVEPVERAEPCVS